MVSPNDDGIFSATEEASISFESVREVAAVVFFGLRETFFVRAVTLVFFLVPTFLGTRFFRSFSQLSLFLCFRFGFAHHIQLAV